MHDLRSLYVRANSAVMFSEHLRALRSKL